MCSPGLYDYINRFVIIEKLIKTIEFFNTFAVPFMLLLTYIIWNMYKTKRPCDYLINSSAVTWLSQFADE